jgi:hypothetical protein
VQVFSSESLTDGTAVDSNLFKLGASGYPSQVYIEVGATVGTDTGNNIVLVKMQVSPNYYLEGDPASDARWFDVPESIFPRVYLHVGVDYDPGAIGSGNEVLFIRNMKVNYRQCKLVAQRLQVDAGGTNTITINAWVKD